MKLRSNASLARDIVHGAAFSGHWRPALGLLPNLVQLDNLSAFESCNIHVSDTLRAGRRLDPILGFHSSIIPGWSDAADKRGRMLRMRLLDLEVEALKLPVEERARLAETLLASLDALSQGERRREWTDEAARRDAELDAVPNRGRPVDEVFQQARARLR